jgi:hypothetical protein
MKPTVKIPRISKNQFKNLKVICHFLIQQLQKFFQFKREIGAHPQITSRVQIT